MERRRFSLVVHPGALGDVLLAVPALRALRRAFPDEALVVAAQPRVGGLLAALGVVDDAVDFESLGLAPLFVDDGVPVRVDLVEAAARVVCWFGARDPVFVRRLRALAPGALVAPAAPNTGLVWAHLAATAGPETTEADRQPVSVPADLVAGGAAALRAAGWDGEAPLVIAHAGAGGLAKRWPVEGFAAVLSRPRNVRIVLHAGPADGAATEALAARLGRDTIVLSEPPLPRLAGALAHARGFVGNDSGVSHLAATIGAPTLVLFAPANLPWRPWSASARAQVVQAPSLVTADVAAVDTALARLLA